MLCKRQDVPAGTWFEQNGTLQMAVNGDSFHLEYPGNPRLPLSISVATQVAEMRLGKIPFGIIMAMPKEEQVDVMDVQLVEGEVHTMGSSRHGAVVLHDGFGEAIVVSNQILMGMSSSVCFKTSDGNVAVSGFAYNVVRAMVTATSRSGVLM